VTFRPSLHRRRALRGGRRRPTSCAAETVGVWKLTDASLGDRNGVGRVGGAVGNRFGRRVGDR